MNKIHYNYLIENLVNGMWYKGKRSSYATSFEEDDYFGSSAYVDKDILEYGIENFNMSLISYFDTEEEAYENEAKLITWDDVDDPMCYNKTPGGKFGDDVKWKPVVQFDLDGRRVARYESIVEAGATVGGSTNITNCCLHQNKSSYGYQWFYESEVGDLDNIGPIDAQPKGGHDTTKQPIVIDGVEYKSKAIAAKTLFPEYAHRTDGGQLRKEFKELLENG